MINYREELPALLASLGAGFFCFHAVRSLKKYLNQLKKPDYVPVGVVKSLQIYPLKSGRGHRVFSFFCGPRGPIIGELKDREFQLIDGPSGNFYSARQKPQIILIETNVVENHLYVKVPGFEELVINLGPVRDRKDVKRALWKGLNIHTIDCGEEVSRILSKFLEEQDVRMVLYDETLLNERVVKSNPNWWNNNPVPERNDRVNFHDFTPYLIQTEASLQDLNSRLETPIEQRQLRPVIVVDKCAEWDEDKWSEIRIGEEVELQCYLPCYRCVLTTIDPASGTKNPDLEPLKTLRTYRLATGNMRQWFKESPLFGVCAGLLDNKTGYIHEGQVVYARYVSLDIVAAQYLESTTLYSHNSTRCPLIFWQYNFPFMGVIISLLSLLPREQNEKERISNEAFYKQFQRDQPPDPEPLEIELVPSRLLYRVFDKIRYDEFTRLEETSSSIANLCGSKKFRLPVEVPNVYIDSKNLKVSMDIYVPRIFTPWEKISKSGARIAADFVIVSDQLSGRKLWKYCSLFIENGTTASVLDYSDVLVCAPAQLGRLIKILKVSQMNCRSYVPRAFFQSNAFQTIHSVGLRRTGCTDEDFLRLTNLRSVYMLNDEITAEGLNLFLKQWKRGERVLKSVDIAFDTSTGSRDLDAILDGLDANVVWTPNTHGDSIVRKVELEHYLPPRRREPYHVYSILRSDDVQNPAILNFSQGRFELNIGQTETDYIITRLDEDQYYLVMGMCVTCKKQFCRHRRRFSFSRLKREYPIVYEALLWSLLVLYIPMHIRKNYIRCSLALEVTCIE